MSKKARYHAAEKIAEKISVINDRTFSFCETEDEHFDEAMSLFQITEPILWEEKPWNRQQCYSNMYSKLFLAYLLTEIRIGNMISENILAALQSYSLDTWELFAYDDIGEKIGHVLAKIVQAVIKKEDLFRRYCLYIDTTEFSLIEDWDDYSAERLYDYLINEVPILKEVLDKKESDSLLSNLAWAMVCHEEFDVEIEVIESTVLFQIYQKEEVKMTDLGQEILRESNEIFSSLLHQDYLTYDLAWEVIDKDSERICYYMITCSEIIGDNTIFREQSEERIHRYNYESIFRILELQEKIKKYQL